MSAPVEKLPVVPVPPPFADEHEEAFVEVQLTVALAPLAIEDGLAETVTVGAGAEPATETFALPDPVPPVPVQVTVYEALVVSAAVWKLPVVPVPPPLADAHDEAFAEVQLMVDFAPLAIEVGLAVTVTVGKGLDGLGVGEGDGLPGGVGKSGRIGT